jgi:hypothetical protein
MASPEHVPSLQFYWYEIKPDEQVGSRWAQIIVAVHRLRFVCDELIESIPESVGPEIEKTLQRLAYNAENYLIRAYELRERVVSLLVVFSGASTKEAKGAIARNLKNSKTRTSTIGDICKAFPKVARPSERLLVALEDDIKLRNFHTHDIFLAIGLWTGNDIFDPADALVDLDSQPKSRKRLEVLLCKGAKRLARQYERKADRVIYLAMALVKAADPYVTAQLRGHSVSPVAILSESSFSHGYE